MRSVFLVLSICSACVFQIVQPGQLEAWNTHPLSLTALWHLTFSLTHYRHALQEPTILHSSGIWWPAADTASIPFCAPAISTQSQKKNQDQFFPSSQPLKYLMPFWHSDTVFPFCPPCPFDLQYFQVFLLDFRNTMKINFIFLSMTVLVYYSDLSCWSIGN